MRLGPILSCVAAAPLLIAAVQPTRLQPSSPWVVDYAENSCRLVRTFGADKQLVKLEFQSPAPGETSMLLEGKPLATDSSTVWATFLPVGSKPLEGTVASTVTRGDPAMLWSSVPMLPDATVAKIKAEEDQRHRKPQVRPPALSLDERASRRTQRQAFASAATELEIFTRSDRTVILETGSLGDPFAAFDKCSRDSLSDWGIDPDVQDKIVRDAWAPNSSRWITSGDYPQNMLDRDEESVVNLRVQVDATGKVSNCTSLSHFNAPDFNRISCALVEKRAHFQPAELADGTKVPSYFLLNITFRIQ